MSYKSREGKPDYSLLNRAMLDPLVEPLTFGVGKHGRYNYLTNPDVTDDELLAAARRHALEAPDAIDAESGCKHGGMAMANFAMWFHRQAARAEKTAPEPSPRPATGPWKPPPQTEPVADQCIDLADEEALEGAKGGKICGLSDGVDWVCTRLPAHQGRHIASNGEKILNRWWATISGSCSLGLSCRNGPGHESCRPRPVGGA